MYGRHAEKYANKVGMMHESQGQFLAMAYPCILFTILHENYLVAI